MARRIHRIGFVGLGRMGLPMASRLAAAGHEVRGFDTAGPARAAFDRTVGDAHDARAADGTEPSRAAATLAAAAYGADAVILMLPDSRVITTVTRDDGLLSAMSPESLLIDMSSSEPAKTEELAATAARRGIRVVGAPVSGGVKGAAEGTLTIMAGGAARDVARARPVLDVLGGRVIHVGEAPGAGHALKALNNLLAATSMLATSEAMLAGQRLGLDPAVMLEVINTSTGRSFATERNWPDHILTGGYDSGFAMRLMVKDALIGLGVVRGAGTGAALSEMAVRLWRRAAGWLPDGADHTEIARWLEHTRQGAADFAELRVHGDQGAVGQVVVRLLGVAVREFHAAQALRVAERAAREVVHGIPAVEVRHPLDRVGVV